MKGEMKVVGRRKIASGLKEMDRLQQLLQKIRGNTGVCPRGVYRFKSFKEADEWLMNMLVKNSLESRHSKTY